MLDDIEIEKIIQDIDSGLKDYPIGKKYHRSPHTINDIRKKHEENQKEAKKQVVSQDGEEEIDRDKNQINKKQEEVHFDSAESKIRAIPKAIDNFIETEKLKAVDRAEWEKRKEEIKKILEVEVNGRIAEEREDAIEERDEQWRRHIKENYEEKEVATNLRSILEEKYTTIEDLTETIEEKDDLITNLNALRETNAELNDYIENFLDDAGRREKNACVREQNRLKQMKSDFDSACVEKQNRLEQERSGLDRYISRLSNWRSELDQRDKDQNKRNEEQDERDKKLSELQKLLEDQADKQQIERKEITQEQDERDKKVSEVQKLLEDQKDKQQIKDNELEQKGDTIAAEKKDLMDFAREIGRELSELSRAEKLRRISVF